jgi:hypothetical protein
VALTPRDAYLRRTYGITEAEYLDVLDHQGGRCAICLKKPVPGKNLHVDHDHRTHVVRGLLCMTCNHDLLGRRDKDPSLFTRAHDYLVDPPAVAVLGPRAAPARPRRRRKTARKSTRSR